MHKITCKINQETLKDPLKGPQVHALNAFAAKHRPTWQELGEIALGLVVDPKRCLRDLLLIFLVERPESRRAETRYYATDAEVQPLEFFDEEGEAKLRGQLMLSNAQHRKAGSDGCFFVVLICQETESIHVAPVGFSWASLVLRRLRPGMPWKDEMLRRLNEGIVL